MTSKNCTKCNTEKSIKEFYKHSSTQDGLFSSCKSCEAKRETEYRQTINGLITRIYIHQKYTSKHREHIPPSYSKSELIEWVLSQSNFDRLYQNWVESSYDKMLAPSIDRADDYKPYSINNLLRVCTWQENFNRGYLDRKNGINNKMNKSVIQMNLDGTFVNEYYSRNEAARQTGINQSSICGCCIGRCNTAGGFRWMESING